MPDIFQMNHHEKTASIAQRTVLIAVAILGMSRPMSIAEEHDHTRSIRVGIIGLDTSHAVAFTELLNSPRTDEQLAGCRVVAAYPPGSPDIESSTKRIPKYTAAMRKMGVEIVDSIDELLQQVDAVLLETNDGRPHLQQAWAVLKAGKPVFIDKPLAGSLADAMVIFQEAHRLHVPVFSASSLRFSREVQNIRQGAVGTIVGCEAYSPCLLEPTHPDLFWYGIHGVETLFTVMGPGCEEVVRMHSSKTDVVVGLWKDGRLGTFRGIRDGHRGNGGTAFGSKGIQTFGRPDRYRPLLIEIVRFFRMNRPPVSAEETLEIYAFMEAADESRRQGGRPISIKGILDKARGQAKLIRTKLTKEHVRSESVER